MPRRYDVPDNTLLGHISQDDLDLHRVAGEEPRTTNVIIGSTTTRSRALVEAAASATRLDAIKIALDGNPEVTIRWIAPHRRRRGRLKRRSPGGRGFSGLPQIDEEVGGRPQKN